MNVTLIDDKSSFDNWSQNSNSEEGLNYVAFASVVKSKHGKNDEKVENIEKSDSS